MLKGGKHQKIAPNGIGNIVKAIMRIRNYFYEIKKYEKRGNDKKDQSLKPCRVHVLNTD